MNSDEKDWEILYRIVDEIKDRGGKTNQVGRRTEAEILAGPTRSPAYDSPLMRVPAVEPEHISVAFGGAACFGTMAVFIREMRKFFEAWMKYKPQRSATFSSGVHSFSLDSYRDKDFEKAITFFEELARRSDNPKLDFSDVEAFEVFPSDANKDD